MHTSLALSYTHLSIQPANKFVRFISGDGDSSVVRAPDSWLKGPGFKSLQERRENFLLQGRLSVLTLISVSVPPPCYHRHVKDPGHSAKSAGGRLQLNTHTPYVCGFAWSDMVHGCMVYTELAPRWLQFHVAPAMPAPCVSKPLRWILKQNKKKKKKNAL